eukprot:2522174-Rhodomonas_salina.1
MLLHARYARSGTELGYVLPDPFAQRACHALSGTGIGSRCALSGTDIGYAPTPSPVLTSAMLL